MKHFSAVFPALFFSMMMSLLLLSCSREAEPGTELSSEALRLEQIAVAENRFRTLMLENPDSPEFRPQARFLAEEYRMFAYRYPEHSMAPEMLFLAANLFADALDEPGQAVALFRQLAQEWPDTPQAERSLFLAGYTYHHLLGEPDNAREMYARLIEAFPESDLREAAQDDMALIGTDPMELLRNFQQAEGEN
ncbi:Tetratricopeptide repeat-containing protein [Cyclonatronum proteinivorum]|uniref:Tetratricopeptide repeat-containing protein n=1 Tax=Cyclonatronum proteinivorum TaxID=1457365 RepID=A0A345UPB0_9BACT|nr:tetratricopeptide repeat protein [Cyclonatronum proteinivorum]AXJ02312.1 Tetratricopeptide repeat-containing protein [Cyclonatronum proteinivorum]